MAEWLYRIFRANFLNCTGAAVQSQSGPLRTQRCCWRALSSLPLSCLILISLVPLATGDDGSTWVSHSAVNSHRREWMWNLARQGLLWHSSEGPGAESWPQPLLTRSVPPGNQLCGCRGQMEGKALVVSLAFSGPWVGGEACEGPY